MLLILLKEFCKYKTQIPIGLSLSYDIVKAHGGELKVETKEGEGSEFIIDLPLNKVV